MPSTFVRILLFLSSYFPLALIFFVLFFKTYVLASFAVLAIGVLGLLGLITYIRAARRISPQTIQIQSVHRQNSEAMSYVVSYIIPFLSAPFSGWQQGIALSVFFSMLAILYVNSGMIHINPTLNIAGFHIYEIELEDGSTASLISSCRIRRGDKIAAIKVDEDIFLRGDRE